MYRFCSELRQINYAQIAQKTCFTRLLMRELPAIDQDVVWKDWKGIHISHPENLSLSMLVDNDSQARQQAVNMILEIRANCF